MCRYIKKLIATRKKEDTKHMSATTTAVTSFTSTALSCNMVECMVCVSEVPKTHIKKCPHCEFECCTTCIKYHINSSQKTEKNCMNCKKKLPRSILVSFLGKSYIDKLYRTDIKELIFKEEMILVPRSLPEVEKRKNIRTIQGKITTLENIFQKDVHENKLVPGTLEHFEQRGLMTGRVTFYNSQIAALKGMKVQQSVIKQYKFPCENKECNGFVDANWICSICDKETCKHCHTIKEDEHECKQDDIDTVELIKKESKPCPKCNISIMKVNGCDQMWCVSCHTTFDWKTLHIKTSGILHNPEYFRYMRENGIVIPRNPNDNPCMDEYEQAYRTLTLINSNFIKEEKTENNMKKRVEKGKDTLIKEYITNNLQTRNLKLSDELYKSAKVYADIRLKEAAEYEEKHTILKALDNNYLKNLFTFYRDINHLESIEMGQMRNNIQSAEEWNDKLRVNFLDNMILKAKYKSALVKQHKELEFIEESMGYYATIVEVSKAYFISKINGLQQEIDAAINENNKITLDDCKQLVRFRKFIKEVSKNCDKMKLVYGYSRSDYIPRLVHPLLQQKTNK